MPHGLKAARFASLASENRFLATVRKFRGQERLHYDLIRLHANGNDRQQRIFRGFEFLLRLAFLNHGDVPRAGVDDEEIIRLCESASASGCVPTGR